MAFYMGAAAFAAVFTIAASLFHCRALAKAGFANSAYMEQFARQTVRSAWLLLVMAAVYMAVVSAYPALKGGWQIALPLMALASLCALGAVYLLRIRAEGEKAPLQGRFAVAAALCALVCVGGYFAGSGILAMAFLLTPMVAPVANIVAKAFGRKSA